MQKMTLTLPPEVIDTLKQKAKSEGLLSHTTFARAIILKELQSVVDSNSITIKVPVKNFKELKAYVDAKKLGSLEVFATYAMELAMSRAPLSEAQKARVVENDGF
ncbi:MAG: hypothetical protein LBV17_09425 [Treponema sp.]|jgi:hypothetical protein|nr:hypothetical protein [Treponema sp.]